LATTLPVVISDTYAVYLYGLDILAQQQAERQYYMHDGLGSVRQLVDTTGQIETNYAYDPFGVPVMGGDGSNPYQFTGEAWDAEVELLYLRARYYQPEVGRFVTKDLWAGNVWRPGTLNRYVYVGNNPVNLADPTGRNGENGDSGPGPDPHGLRDGEWREPRTYPLPPGELEGTWEYRDLTLWLHKEMRANVDGPEGRVIRTLLVDTGPTVTSWNIRYKEAGIKFWNSLVADKCKWDFKHAIWERLGDSIMLRHLAPPSGEAGYHWYEYSVPGNIFFAWMGMAVGLSDNFLHIGAGAAEMIDPVHQERQDCDITRKVPIPNPVTGEPDTSVCINYDWLRTGLDEPGDWWNVEFGIRLYKTYGPHLSYTDFLSFLGSNGGMLTPGAIPRDEGSHNGGRPMPGTEGGVRRWPYEVGCFNGSGCSGR
jgi:RHS repeat-associated protein